MDVLIKLLTILGFFEVMLSMGFKVTLIELLNSLRRTKLLAISLVANFLLTPAMTWVLLSLLNPHPMVSVGFLLRAACPGAPIAPPLVAIARGDVPLAVGQTEILSAFPSLCPH